MVLVDAHRYPEGRDPRTEFAIGRLRGAALAPPDEIYSVAPPTNAARPPPPTPGALLGGPRKSRAVPHDFGDSRTTGASASLLVEVRE
jgi:hypothetical protein